MIKQARNKELEALIDLLDDPDELMNDVVQKKILDIGSDAILYLKESLCHTVEPLKSSRLKELISKLNSEDNGESFRLWLLGKEKNLFEGFIVVSKILNPDFEENSVRDAFAQLQRDVWLELNDNLTALEKVQVLNHILFQVHNYTYSNDVLLTENDLLSIFVDKKGSSLSLSILYLIIAQSLKLPIYCGNVPRQFILTYLDREVFFNIDEDLSKQVLFYLSPQYDGIVFTRNEIRLYLKEMELDIKDEYFEPMNNLMVVRRVLEAVQREYHLNGDLRSVAVCKQMIAMFDA